MLYRLTKPFAKIAFQVYFRKLYLSHLENVPVDKPVILATNHPTAFIEPCIMACWMPKPLSFLARGDLYIENPFIRKLYDWYHLIPVFRIVDAGYSNVKNNYESFERCLDALSKKHMVMILAEGRVRHEKRLRPVVKGTARIVFSMLEKYGDQDVQVIPVGVTYSNPDDFRSIAMLDFGAPIAATEYTERYRENPAKAITDFTQELAIRIRHRMVHIEKVEDEGLVENLLELSRNDFPEVPLPVVEHSDDPLRREIATAKGINRMTGPDKDALRQRTDRYFQLLNEKKLTDFGVLNAAFYKTSTTLLVALGWLPFALGYFLNYLPLKAGRILAERLAPSIEFIASMAGVFGTLFWLFYIALWAGMIGWCSGSWWWALLILIVPFLGLFSLTYQSFFSKWKQARAAAMIPKEELKSVLRRRPFFQP